MMSEEIGNIQRLLKEALANNDLAAVMLCIEIGHANVNLFLKDDTGKYFTPIMMER